MEEGPRRGGLFGPEKREEGGQFDVIEGIRGSSSKFEGFL